MRIIPLKQRKKLFDGTSKSALNMVTQFLQMKNSDSKLNYLQVILMGEFPGHQDLNIMSGARNDCIVQEPVENPFNFT